jgi:predicted MFS family arabinose efflux permease
VTSIRLISIVSIAHFVSHLLQIALPPLFPVVREEFGVSWVAVGLLMTVFYSVSGVGQAIAGFLVDRYGARLMLLIGTALFAGATVLMGLAPSFHVLVVAAVVAAVGNSVFHPADYAIFNAAIERGRLGRAFSAHGIGGSLGYAIGPALAVGLAALVGWRGALVALGVAGLGWVLVLAWQTRGLIDHRQPIAEPERPRQTVLSADFKMLFSAPILAAFAYFAFLATATAGLQTFGVPALMAIYLTPIGAATSALSGYLIGKSVGVLAGGFVVDRTTRHDVLAGGGMLIAAGFMLVVSTGAASMAVVATVMALAGLSIGVAQPARDMLVRAATPSGASGKVFGFAYAGLDVGSAFTPVVFGWLMDHGQPRTLFVAIATLMVLTIGTVVAVRRQSTPDAVELKPLGRTT